MVFYFTATGNSLYVAKQLDTHLVSIPQVINGNNLSFRDDSIGVVCPVFGHEAPPMVKEFQHKAAFETDYFYMILTYGNRHGGAAELAQQLLESCGIQPAYINVVLMTDNFLPAFDMNEQKRLDKHIDEQISVIRTDIEARRYFISPVTDTDHAAHQDFLVRSSTPPADRWKNIYQITDACIGCGICSKVCPAACWSLKNIRPVYDGTSCQGCMACIHACPQKAIQLNIPEKNPGARYRNEHIPLAEIIQANQRIE